MSDENVSNIISIIDDDGQEFNLEIIDSIDYNGESYTLFLPADMDEKDPDYGYIILRSVFEDGEEIYESIDDDEELQDVYEKFMLLLFGDEDDEE